MSKNIFRCIYWCAYCFYSMTEPWSRIESKFIFVHCSIEYMHTIIVYFDHIQLKFWLHNICFYALSTLISDWNPYLMAFTYSVCSLLFFWSIKTNLSLRLVTISYNILKYPNYYQIGCGFFSFTRRRNIYFSMKFDL